MTEGHPYLVEGIGEDIVPGTFQPQYIDEMVTVSDKDAFVTARRLAREEGLMVGGSCGAAVFGALEAVKGLDEDKIVVVLLPDTGERYLSKFHSDEWMREHRMMEAAPVTVGDVVAAKGRAVPAIVTVEAGEKVGRALDLMRTHNISQLPVFRAGKPVGRVEEGDLMDLLLSGGGKGDDAEEGVMKEARAMVTACAKQRVPLVINHQRRMGADLIAARRIIENGQIGEVKLVRGQCQGDILSDGTHLIDSVQWLTGDRGARWIMEGKAMLWFSNRDGLKAVAQSGGAQSDAYAMFFTKDAWDRFRLTKEEFALVKEAEEKKNKPDAAKDKKGETKKEEPKVEEVVIDLDGLNIRKARLTIHSSSMGDALVSKDGETLYYLARFEKGMNLWTTNLRTKETKMLAQLNANGGSMQWDKEQKSIFLVAYGGTIRNVIMGNRVGDGIHCEGSCTIENVWFPNVCDDAITGSGSLDAPFFSPPAHYSCSGRKPSLQDLIPSHHFFYLIRI